MGSEAINFTTHKGFADRIKDVFPYYLSIGMTEQQFWDGDSELPIAYRKADKLRKQQRNQELWLQGAYIYEALCDVAPIYNAFAKKGTKPVPYSNEPYCLTEQERQEREQEKAKARMEKMRQQMYAMSVEFNKKFKEKQEAVNNE